MRTGRPSKPTELKRRQGTLRKHRTNKREPKLPLGAPPTPTDLDPLALKEWRELVSDVLRMRVLTASDRGILRACARACSMWEQAEAAIAQHGTTYETENTSGSLVIKHRPEVVIVQDAWRRYVAALVQLGLTPSARGKVSEVGTADEDEVAQKYFN